MFTAWPVKGNVSVKVGLIEGDCEAALALVVR
jgi:hypothetical protein